MRKSKILGIALAAAMVSSIAATAAFSASAKVSGTEGIVDETVGITGSFANWGNPDADTGAVTPDVPMTDEDGDGIWEGTIKIDSVTEAMLSQAMTDPGDEHPVPRTDITAPAVQFKIRTNGDWKNSWGDYEVGYNRTWNSQTNCAVVGEVGKPLTIKVKLDTTKTVDQSQFDEDDRYSGADAYNVWPVSYEVVAEEAPAEEPKSEEPKSEEPKSEEPKSEEPKSEKPAEETKEDTKPVETGDAASAAALVAVVLASLGTAVVMTKKASAKD